jgi:hypothetical protein
VPEESLKGPGIKLKPSLTYKEEPFKVLDIKDHETHNRTVRTYKIQWSHHDERDATWKTAEYIKKAYKNFYDKWFVTQNLRTRFL